MPVNIKKYYRRRPVLITGGLGFLGSNLAHRLAGLGARVTVLDCLLTGHGGNYYNLAGLGRRVKVHEYDIRQPRLEKILRGQEVIFHFAGHTSHVDSMKDPFIDIDINCRGNANLLQAINAA